jgi:tetratricopeptide (TPR) repeat protein
MMHSSSPALHMKKQSMALKALIPANPIPVRRQIQHVTDPEATVLKPQQPEPPGPSPDTVLHDVNMSDFIRIRSNSRQARSPSETAGVRDLPARVRANPINQPPEITAPAPPLAPRPARSSSSFDAELQEIRKLNDSVMKNSVGTRTPSPSLRGGTPSIEVDNYEEADKEEEATTASGQPIYVPYTPDLRAKLGAATTLHTHVQQKPMCLRDYQMLAEACQRAGRARTEGHAYYKIGEVLAQNKRDTLAKSVVYFKRYLNIARRLNDLQGEAKALNCLGIVHYELGGMNNWHIALEYHKQHSEIADAAGIFISNTNMGLTHAKMGNLLAAAECHKHALQYAVRAGDKAAESLALSNLGLAGTKQGDASTAKVCIERHLELATTLHDEPASCEAYEQLGILASQRGDFATASENLLLALDVAIRTGEQNKAVHLRCEVGVVQAMLKMEEQMKQAAANMGA